MADMVEHEQKQQTNEQREPHWRRRILEKQKMLSKDLGEVSKMKRNKLHNIETNENLARATYHMNKKGTEVVHEEVKQRLMLWVETLKGTITGQSS